MIYTLYGEIFEIDRASGYAVIDCCGVGYKMTVNERTLSRLPQPEYDASGELKRGSVPVRVYTYLAVREDDVELFGFSGKDELEAFKMLITVSGVGPKVAMGVLSVFDPEKLYSSILSEDTKGISRAPGIGGKTAARIVLELRDRVAKIYSTPVAAARETGDGPVPTDIGGGKLADARDALLVLGYSRAEIMNAFKSVDPSAPTEKIIKDALAALMKR